MVTLQSRLASYGAARYSNSVWCTHQPHSAINTSRWQWFIEKCFSLVQEINTKIAVYGYLMTLTQLLGVGWDTLQRRVKKYFCLLDYIFQEQWKERLSPSGHIMPVWSIQKGLQLTVIADTSCGETWNKETTWEDPDVYGRVILKWIFWKWDKGMD